MQSMLAVMLRRACVWGAMLGLVGLAKAPAQDPPPFTPSPAKPKVQGWATSRVEEKLNRGVVAMPVKGGKVYVGWRLLAGDPKEIAFNLYRSADGGAEVKVNAQPLTKTTDFVDEKPAQGANVQYWVKPVNGGQEGEASEKAAVGATGKDAPYVSIKLQGNYVAQKIGVADLNGDGQYDYVIKQPKDNIDPYGPYWQRSPDTYKLEAYLADGTFLWRYDLGWSIERGIWYSPYLVYDFDGDGKAEVAVKTGEGDPRDPDGRVTRGPEWLTILDGMTGKEVTKIPWISRDPRIGDYNHLSRNQLGVAFLDGKTPCLLMERGTYELMVLEAYTFKNKKLEKVWRWESEENGKTFKSQGAHYMHSGDIDGDGRDEVILGCNVVDDDGRGMWSTGLGHPDKSYVGDLDPTRPGMEIYFVVEPRQKTNGVIMVDAMTGKILWNLGRQTWHVGYGECADIDPSIPGVECWAGEDPKGDPKRSDYGGNPPRWLFSAQGKLLGENSAVPPLTTEMAWWDGDLLREIPTKGGVIYKYGKGVIEKNTDGAPLTTADVLGDWREEIITCLPGEMRIYTTTIPATDRRPCLMQDPIYRHDVAHNAMGYTQAPTTSFYLGYTDPQPFERDPAAMAYGDKVNTNKVSNKNRTWGYKKEEPAAKGKKKGKK